MLQLQRDKASDPRRRNRETNARRGLQVDGADAGSLTRCQSGLMSPPAAHEWARDVTEDVAREPRERCADRGEVPASLQEFLDHHRQ